MEETYLIEIRLTRTKWRVKTMVFAIAEQFGLGDFMERHPHVTLFGPLVLNETSQEELLDAISSVAGTYDPVLFTIDGWEKKAGMNGSVLAFSVQPSAELQRLTRSISDKLGPMVTSLNAWDAHPEKKWFHVTIANRLMEERASVVFRDLERESLPVIEEKAHSRIFPAIRMFLARVLTRERNPVIWPLLIDETGLRITVLQGEEILGEYDLLEKRWFMGRDVHDTGCTGKTLSDFRRYSGFELSTPPAVSDDIFLIADLHFGHANIIRYCSRPFLFSDVREMDRVLIQNWNSTIAPGGRAFFLGDLRYGKDAPPASYYRDQLMGEVTYVGGNHDDRVPGMIRSAELTHDGMRFHLVHDPADAPPGFEGWVIHGHHHNNNLEEFPFINFTAQRINVSAEVVGYSPVSLREICSRIREAEKTGNHTPVLLRYPYVR